MVNNPSMSIIWKESTPDIKLGTLQDLFVRFGMLDTIRLLQLLDDGNLVLLSKYAKKKIHRHLLQTKIELGGLLIGEVYKIHLGNSENYITSIKNAIPSLDSKSTRVSLKIGTDVWSAAQSAFSRGLLVVGWYHSHPGLGAFFSSTDRSTQNHFFNNPYNVGMVEDPFKQEVKWFSGRDSISVKHILEY